MRSLNWTAEGGSVSRAEALASALSDATSKPANGWLRALAARLPTGETPLARVANKCDLDV